MKKIAPIAILALVAFASCKKDYTCTCEDNDGTKATYEFSNTKKSTAETACNVYDFAWDKGCDI